MDFGGPGGSPKATPPAGFPTRGRCPGGGGGVPALVGTNRLSGGDPQCPPRSLPVSFTPFPGFTVLSSAPHAHLGVGWGPPPPRRPPPDPQNSPSDPPPVLGIAAATTAAAPRRSRMVPERVPVLAGLLPVVPEPTVVVPDPLPAAPALIPLLPGPILVFPGSFPSVPGSVLGSILVFPLGVRVLAPTGSRAGAWRGPGAR